MSYATCVAALAARLATVSGPVAVLQYEPTAIQATPLVMVLFDHAEIVDRGQVAGARWYVTVRVVVKRQDFEQAEVQAVPYIDSILAKLRADEHLGLTGAMAPLVEMAGVEVAGGYLEIEGVASYRIIDFTVPVLDKDVS